MSAQTIPDADRFAGSPVPSPARGLPAWTIAVPLAVLAVVAFLPILDNGFVNLDDEPNFL